MISIGVDVAKEKCTICAIKSYGEILFSPKNYKHSIDDLNRYNGKDKLCNFIFDYWRCDNTTKSSEKVFIKKYLNWLKKKGYRQNENEAR